LTALLVTFSLQCHGEEYSHPQKAEAKEHLAEMLTRKVDPFLIIETADGGSYIQFYNENPGLMIDLPEMALSDSEIEKAREYFRKNGIPLIVTKAINPKTKREFELRTWSKKFHPGEIERATEIAFGALFEIYGISGDTPLIFKKGWE
jgi:hypothetical protein